MVDHETVCDCRFADECETFKDPLIDNERKGREGFGCRQQHDLRQALPDLRLRVPVAGAGRRGKAPCA